jgi:hypothetical protein
MSYIVILMSFQTIYILLTMVQPRSLIFIDMKESKYKLNI